MARVYVGGLHYNCRERDLERFFKRYGRLRDCLIKNGYGFVEFEDERDADDAVYEMNGRELLGERVTVEHARGLPRRGGYSGFGGRDRDRERRPAWLDRKDKRYGPPTRTPYRVIVENLSSRISWQVGLYNRVLSPAAKHQPWVSHYLLPCPFGDEVGVDGIS
ncbi:Serine-arginine protein 55-like 2 [Homarus americanus]|uniref:Serine-arginine protein 55-like 2 n=1 Tax=Homarus americanus TaxID=6706 RepID=A0A8J5KEW0_HOMAM|nr:Serine-arginine protein 55-like 2 [Homarus americanus]